MMVKFDVFLYVYFVLRAVVNIATIKYSRGFYQLLKIYGVDVSSEGSVTARICGSHVKVLMKLLMMVPIPMMVVGMV